VHTTILMINPTGEIFTILVKQELGNSCTKCGNTDLCTMPKDTTPKIIHESIPDHVKLWERYIQDSSLIKKELFRHCHKCDGNH